MTVPSPRQSFTVQGYPNQPDVRGIRSLSALDEAEMSALAAAARGESVSPECATSTDFAGDLRTRRGLDWRIIAAGVALVLAGAACVNAGVDAQDAPALSIPMVTVATKTRTPIAPTATETPTATYNAPAATVDAANAQMAGLAVAGTQAAIDVFTGQATQGAQLTATAGAWSMLATQGAADAQNAQATMGAQSTATVGARSTATAWAITATPLSATQQALSNAAQVDANDLQFRITQRAVSRGWEAVAPIATFSALVALVAWLAHFGGDIARRRLLASEYQPEPAEELPLFANVGGQLRRRTRIDDLDVDYAKIQAAARRWIENGRGSNLTYRLICFNEKPVMTQTEFEKFQAWMIENELMEVSNYNRHIITAEGREWLDEIAANT